MTELKGLRDDVYRRPLATALERLGVGPGWRCVDVGAGGGDVSVALAEVVGHTGRVYAVDSRPARPATRWPGRRRPTARCWRSPRPARTSRLPEPVDLAFCRFLLLHVFDPAMVLRKMAEAVRTRTMGGGPGAGDHRRPYRRAAAVHARRRATPTWVPSCRRSPATSGLELVDAWAEAPAGAGPGPVASYLEELTGVDPGDEPVVLPPLVTVVSRRRPEGSP